MTGTTSSMPLRDLIVMGGSAGSISVLQSLLAALPADLPAALMVVVHQGGAASGHLAEVLDRAGPLPAVYPRDGEPLERGRVYVARPDHHLLVSPDGRVEVTRGPKENGFRPALDALFRTAARAFGARVIGVVLSGMLDDGTVGVLQIKRAGGVAVAQDPSEAAFPDMPATAIRCAPVDYVLRAHEIPEMLARLVRAESNARATVTAGGAEASRDENGGGMAMTRDSESSSAAGGSGGSVGTSALGGDIAERGDIALTAGTLPGPPSGLTCPECGGAVWESEDGKMVQFRCHVGHRYSSESFAAAHGEEVEAALWTALRMLQEYAALHQRLTEKARAGGMTDAVIRFEARANEYQRKAEALRRVLLKENPPA